MKKTVFTLLLILSYLTTFAQNTKWSEYGKFFTPKKELRIMIIFVSLNIRSDSLHREPGELYPLDERGLVKRLDYRIKCKIQK